MFTPRNFKALLFLSASLLLFHPHASAQSGRRAPTPGTVPGTQPATPPADYARLDKVRVVVARALDDFVRSLNEQGRLGYRLEKTASQSDPLQSPRFAAVLRLDPGHTYDYFSSSMPEDARHGDPLNYDARRGYVLAHAFPLVHCRRVDVFDAAATDGSYSKQETRTEKWNALLFMRRDAAEVQTKEYRVFRNLFTLDAGQKKELQAALDAAPQGFRPVRFLFSEVEPLLFNVAVLAERDLNEAAPPKVEYELVKEVFGFEDEVNRLAAAGSRYAVGARNGFVKFTLLERQTGGAVVYTFKDAHQQEKEFPRMLAAGNRYVGLLTDHPTCDHDGSQKLVFARGAVGAPAGEYKVLELADRKTSGRPGLLTTPAVSELQRLLAEGFRLRDVFHTHRLYAILERPAGAPAPRTETSER